MGGFAQKAFQGHNGSLRNEHGQDDSHALWSVGHRHVVWSGQSGHGHASLHVHEWLHERATVCPLHHGCSVQVCQRQGRWKILNGFVF